MLTGLKTQRHKAVLSCFFDKVFGRDIPLLTEALRVPHFLLDTEGIIL